MKTYGGSSNIPKDKAQKLLINRESENLIKTDKEKFNDFAKLFKPKAEDRCSFKKSITKSKKTIKSKNNIQQSILQFGQKPAATIIKCRACGMEYNKLLVEDVDLHKKYHLKFLNILSWPMNDFTDQLVGRSMIHLKSPNDQNIKAWKKALDVLRMVNEELGAAQQDLSSLSNYQVFISLDIMSRRVTGLLLCLPITQSFRVIPQSSSFEYDKENPKGDALCGISRIWVGAESRKQGIATQLLDCVRQHFLFGSELEKDQLAFSQPTDLGQALASRYFERSDYLIYIE